MRCDQIPPFRLITYPSPASGIFKKASITKRLAFPGADNIFCSVIPCPLSFLSGIQTGIMKKILTRFLLPLMCSCCFKGLFSQNKQIDSLLNVLATAKEDTAKVNTLNNLSRKFYESAEWAESKKYADDALLIAQKIGFKKGTANAFNHIANAYANQSNDDEALKNYFASLKIREEIGDKRGIANSYNNISRIYFGQGKYPEAMKNNLAALKIGEEIGDKALIGNSYNFIGHICLTQGSYSEALKNYFATLKIRKEIGDKAGVAHVSQNIGVVYDAQGNYSEALKSYISSLELSEEIGDKLAIAGCYHEIGTTYREMGNYSEALENSLAAIKISKEIGAKNIIAASYISVGTINIALKNYFDARQFLNDGLSLSKEIGSNEYIKDSYGRLVELDSATGDYSLALEHYKLYTLYKDSLLNETNNQQIAQMKEQYESEKKDKEIIQLESDKTKLESEKQIGALLLKAKQDSLGIVEAEKEKIKLENDKVKLENEKIQAFNLYSQQQIELLGNEKKIQQLQIDKDQAEYAIQKAEADKKQEQLTVLNKEKDIKDLQLRKQKQTKNYFLAGLVLFVILSFFVYRNYQNQRKVNQLMNVAYAKDKAELELQSLRAQLNPHFMFNSLNAIQELILKEDFDNSHTYLARFAKLLRMLLENAEKPFVPLNSEIDFLELYLSLEKLRIPDLQFSIKVDPAINTGDTLLPNMVLQPYIENALWHGLSQKIGEKNVELIIDKQNGAVIYSVKDNGIGRRKAAEFKSLYRKEHKSKGMELLTKRFKLLHEEFGSEIKTQVNDVMNNGEAGGTLVSIYVPNSISLAKRIEVV